MMKTTKVLELYRRQNALNWSKSQSKKLKKLKRSLKPKSQKTTALIPNPIKNFSFHSNSMPISLYQVSNQYMFSYKNFRWLIYLV